MTVPTRSRRSRILSPLRAAACLAVGAAGGLVVGLLGWPELVALVGWTIAASVALVWVWRTSWPQDARGTKRLAEEEGPCRSTDSAVLIAAGISLVAVAEALVRSSGDQDPVAVTLVILGIVAAVLSWALVNTVFALKYARLYYIDEDGGIDFRQDRPPAYSDFAYMAFMVGMAYAMAETEPENTHIRKVVLGHALLSYAFGTGILAVAINLVTNLGQ
jgi:uncharacterized membrane protein